MKILLKNPQLSHALNRCRLFNKGHLNSSQPISEQDKNNEKRIYT